jgi:hypothetical protein
LVIVVVGVALRWMAHRQRAVSPRQFGAGELGRWVPPLPRPDEFASRYARWFEVGGRAATYVGVCVMVVDALHMR